MDKQQSGLSKLMSLYERMLIIKTLLANGCSRALTASALGITRQRLWYRMRALQIDINTVPRQYPGRPRKKFARQQTDKT